MYCPAPLVVEVVLVELLDEEELLELFLLLLLLLLDVLLLVVPLLVVPELVVPPLMPPGVFVDPPLVVVAALYNATTVILLFITVCAVQAPVAPVPLLKPIASNPA